jgi:hypothetical protein
VCLRYSVYVAESLRVLGVRTSHNRWRKMQGMFRNACLHILVSDVFGVGILGIYIGVLSPFLQTWQCPTVAMGNLFVVKCNYFLDC